MHLRLQIPAHNEAATLARVLRDASAAGRQLIGERDRLSMLVIDDGSSDATSAVCERLAGDLPELVVHRNRRRMGLGRSFRIGVRAALRDQVDVLAHLDADDQFDASELGLLVKPIRDAGVDIAVGSRFLDPGRAPAMPLGKRLGNALVASLVSLLTGRRFADVSCGYRAFSRRALQQMRLRGDFTYTHESLMLAAFAGLSTAEVPVTVRGEREFGRSRLASSNLLYGLRAGRIILRTVVEERVRNRGIRRGERVPVP